MQLISNIDKEAITLIPETRQDQIFLKQLETLGDGRSFELTDNNFTMAKSLNLTIGTATFRNTIDEKEIKK